MKKYFAVTNHHGEPYIWDFISSGSDSEEKEVEFIEERCETCGDGDVVLGVFDTLEDADVYLEDKSGEY